MISVVEHVDMKSYLATKIEQEDGRAIQETEEIFGTYQRVRVDTRRSYRAELDHANDSRSIPTT